MAKTKHIFVCQNCGASHSKWSGKCEDCGEWNTLVEQASESTASASGKALQAQVITSVDENKSFDRLMTGLSEIDDVLGGGIVPGGVYLLAGQPGMGKSTILLQLANMLAEQDYPILYVSGEESLSQIKLRADRLAAHSSKLAVASGENAHDIAASIRSGQYKVVVVDSIQTISLPEVTSAPGSVSQITNASNIIIRAAKHANVSVILVGHVTKEGSIAGPKILEHLVDVVINFEGDRYGGFKMFRAVKNRYGSTNEVALMEMFDEGLRIAENPSQALLSERQVSDGSVVLATIEGTRPLLVEVQALVTTTSFGYPKRAASGIDLNRLNLLIAMLTRRTKLNLADKDIYINIVGGIKLTDPAADLAICMSIASAAKGMALKDDAVVFGEVGLSGEIRHVSHIDKRIAEARKLGFAYAIGPKNAEKFVHSAANIRDALNTALSKT